MDAQSSNAKMARETLEPLVGEWTVEASFPDAPSNKVIGRTTFEWMLNGEYLMQRSEVSHPDAPNSFTIMAPDSTSQGFIQHYFDSRGVSRLYEMTFGDGIWTLLRTRADFSPLDFSQRFTGTFNQGKDVIWGGWEHSTDTSTWESDFEMTFRKLLKLESLPQALSRRADSPGPSTSTPPAAPRRANGGTSA
ncbi:DUF1579 family protein [Arthrobacter sp. ERGS1:01]|uniref:DUF1579 family protein n=1 Tax=Arthrobacter sp. ERGS1:01 TaxID=1704044 RepID=UPI0009E9049E|nr:DUF1579 family protein [Arthrobacter sp. ERGS1:01]